MIGLCILFIVLGLGLVLLAAFVPPIPPAVGSVGWAVFGLFGVILLIALVLSAVDTGGLHLNAD